MSGFEIVGLISALISVVVTIEDLYSALREETNLPRAFHDIAARLPLVQDTLRISEENIDPNADEEAYQAMRVAVDNCKIKADRLEEIFRTIAPSDSGSRIERYRRVVRDWGKGNKVEDLAKGMMEDVRALAMNRAVQTATQAQVAELLEAIKEISNIQPSLSDEESISQNHTGSGDNIAGNKYQGNHNVNNGNGPAYFGQYIHQEFYSSGNCQTLMKTESNIDTCLRMLPSVAGNSTVIEDCEPATWILENETYQSWFYHNHERDVTAALLILRGKVGIGKSVLMRQLATDTRVINDDVTIRIHHSFRPEPVMSASLESMRKDLTMLQLSLLSSLVNQFQTDDTQAIAELAAQLRRMTNPAAWNECDLNRAIIDFFKENKAGPKGLIRFRIFIDGIEDCSPANPQPPAAYNGSLNNEASKVLAFASKLLMDSVSEGIDIGICLSRGYFMDDGAYEPTGQSTTQKLPKWKIEKVLDPTFSFNLHRRSTNGFLWASRVTEGILHAKSSTTIEEYRKLVEDVPDNFSDFYAESLKRMSLSESSKEALSYLRLILGAARSLSSEEFRHASADFRYADDVSENDRETSNAPLPSSTFKDRIRQTTMGLIEVAKVNKSASDFGQRSQPIGDMVRFIHPSVIKFLRGEQKLHRENRIDEIQSLRHFYPKLSENWNAECHLLLFQICMRALKACTLSEADDGKITKYAFEFWPCHAKGAGVLLEERDKSHVPDLMLKCTKNPRTKLHRVIEEQIKYLKFIQAREFWQLARHGSTDEGSGNGAAARQQPSMFMLLATLGCTTLALQHLNRCSACGGRKPKGTPSTDQLQPSVSDQQLTYAIENAILCEHSDTASVLLEFRSGKDLSFLSARRSPCTILHQACYFDQLEIVEFLLSNGADPTESSPHPYEYPLTVAIVTGNIKLINILLDEKWGNAKKILEMRSKRKGHKTALHFAVTTRQRPETKLAALEAVVACAPQGLGLLKLVDSQGRTPCKLAEGLPEDIGPDIIDVLYGFADDDEVNGC